MKITTYFQYTRQRADRKRIRDAWIMKAITEPEAEEVQSDGRIRRWTWIDEEGEFLRVILLEDSETVHNAFFDRGFKR